MRGMKTSTIEAWVWVLVYGGLLTVGVGVFLLRGGAPGLGWTLVALGTVSALGSLGMAFVSPITQSLISGSGWQTALVAFFGIIAVMLPAAFLAQNLRSLYGSLRSNHFGIAQLLGKLVPRLASCKIGICLHVFHLLVDKRDGLLASFKESARI